MSTVDSVILVSFGGPEGPDDVVPFLENVTRGRGIPAERLVEVGRHYLEVFDGVSPLPEQCRQLRAALQELLPDLPVYWGNRNWHPFVGDTLQQMAADGRTHALAVTTSSFPSYSGCRQYREDLAAHAVPGLLVEKVRHHYLEDGFVNPMRRGIADLPGRLVFTAHSIPLSMAASSGPDGDGYVTTLRLACAAVAGEREWDLVWQSRSGPPSVPWLEPDVGDHLQELYDSGCREAVLVPIGFTSDHVEVVYDLDVQAADRVRADMPDLVLHRAPTVGTDPEYVAMLARLVRERIAGVPAPALPAVHDTCPGHCCPAPARR